MSNWSALDRFFVVAVVYVRARDELLLRVGGLPDILSLNKLLVVCRVHARVMLCRY